MQPLLICHILTGQTRKWGIFSLNFCLWIQIYIQNSEKRTKNGLFKFTVLLCNSIEGGLEKKTNLLLFLNSEGIFEFRDKNGVEKMPFSNLLYPYLMAMKVDFKKPNLLFFLNSEGKFQFRDNGLSGKNALYRVGHKDPPSIFSIDPLSSLREMIYSHFYFEFQLTLFRALK